MTSAVERQFTSRREPLLAAIKTDSFVEAVNAFEFRSQTRTLHLDLASVFRASEEARTAMAYEFATALTGLAWSPEFTDVVRGDEAALPFLEVRVDDQLFRCTGPLAAALGRKELSQPRFAEECRA